MGSSKHRRSELRRRERRAARAKRQRTERRLGVPATRVVDWAALGLGKMSDVLLEFAEPLIDEHVARDRAELDLRLKFAAAIWNCVAAKHLGMRDLAAVDCELLAAAAGEELGPLAENADDRAFVDLMIERKIDEFLDDPRLIQAIDVRYEAGGGVHVSVASQLPADRARDLR